MADFMGDGRTEHRVGLYSELHRVFSDATD
jgi:hypothetical protein